MLFIGSIIKFLLTFVLGKAMKNPAVIGALGGLLSGGGLGKILGSLKGAGMGSLVDSWVSKDKNKPISPDQLESALGEEQLSALAQQAGMPKDRFANEMAQSLPTMVDTLTPNGTLPSADEIDRGLESKFGWNRG